MLPAIPVTDYAKISKKQSLRKQKPKTKENPYAALTEDLHEAKSLIDYINFDGIKWRTS